MYNFDKIFRHIGKHLDTIDALVDQFVAEMFSLTTRDSGTFNDGLISHWEEEYDIYDPASLLIDRQTELNAKVRAVGGDTFEYFENIAAGLGYNIDSAVDPHLRITDGDFPPARADYAKADISAVLDGDAGSSAVTWIVHGTGVESNDMLMSIFNSQKPAGTEVLFIND
jgi:hypothetical protein